jgi:membrane fusion protein (multidrug efflux system)
VDSRVDPTARAVIVRAVVPNGEGLLKPGMFLTVSVAQDRRPALVVPEEALVPEQARQFVYVVEGAKVAKREVMLGRREPGFVEVTAGVAAGERVVIEGTLKLRDGTPVKDVGATPAAAVAATPES